MNTLLDNAVASIQLGVEDFKKSKDDPKRVLSAIRNFHAGILLLFKEKLARRSPKEYGEPPILLRQELKIKFILTPHGLEQKKEVNRTIGLEQIKDRLEKLKIKVDWGRVYRLNNIRNNIEHYKLEIGKEKIEETIWLVFPVIQNFIRDYLGEEPVRLLGKETWQTLLEASETYQKELDICLEAINKNVESNMIKEILFKAIKTGALRCPHCNQSLFKPINNITFILLDSKFLCSSCGQEFYLSESMINRMLDELFYFEKYLAVKEGGEEPVRFCSECGCKSVILDEEDNYFCLCCGSTFNAICDICNQLYRAHEDDLGICPDCYRQMVDED